MRRKRTKSIDQVDPTMKSNVGNARTKAPRTAFSYTGSAKRQKKVSVPMFPNSSEGSIGERELDASTLCTSGNESPNHETSRRYYLLKSEPNSRFEKGIDMKFSIDDLAARPNQVEHWDGVRNYQARNVLNSMKVGDLAFFYHSNCGDPGIAGIVEVVRESYPDHTQFDAKHPHFDSKSTTEKPRWTMVDVKYIRHLRRFVSLADIKERAVNATVDNVSKVLRELPLLQRSRLSCQMVSKQQWDLILLME